MVVPTSLRPVSQRPRASTRRAQCTHMHVTRVYGKLPCTACGRVPSTGWLYTCTQDALDHLAEAGSCISAEQDMGDLVVPEEEDRWAYEGVELSAWMEKAILAGHYTPEQIDVLRVQRRNALRRIAQDLEAKRRVSVKRPVTPANPLSGPSALDQAVSWIDCGCALSRKILIYRRGLLATNKIPTPRLNARLPFVLLVGKLGAPVEWARLIIMRPSWGRDRSWECVDHGYETAPPPMPDFNNDGRPCSDAEVVRQIGLKQPEQSLHRHDSDDSGDLNLSHSTEPDQTDTETSNNATDDSDDEHYITANDDSELERRKQRLSFRLRHGNAQRLVSLRDSFRDPDETRDLPILVGSDLSREEDSNTSDYTSDTDITDAHKENGAMDPFVAHALAALGRVGGAWMTDRQPSAIEHTSKIGHGASMAVKSDGELKVPDGIAVTEEAVDLGTADIITQV
jgi:hypothetical protein